MCVEKRVEHRGGRAVTVVCDFNDLDSVRRGAKEIAALPLSLASLVNNAGMRETKATKNNMAGTPASSPTTSGRSR